MTEDLRFRSAGGEKGGRGAGDNMGEGRTATRAIKVENFGDRLVGQDAKEMEKWMEYVFWWRERLFLP